MAYTKRDIVNQAFEEIGLASYVFDLQPQQLESALQRLDRMMATWNGKGIRLGYPLPSSPADSDLDQVIGVPDSALEAMAANLALRLATMFGKPVSPDTKVIAKKAYTQIITQSATPIEMQLDNTAIPSGAGNKMFRYRQDPFLRDPVDPLQAGPDSILDLE